MAKELPYFQFEPAEYLTKDISFCSLSAQGLFINICSFYWQRQCNLTKDQLLRRFNYINEFDELIDEGVIDLKENGQDIIVKFLDVQFEKAINFSKEQSRKGSLGGRPKKESQIKAEINPKESQTKAIKEDNIIKDNKKESLETRSLAFKETLRPFLNTYGSDMLKKFYGYWSEPNQSKTKMKFELEKTWDTKRRLEFWSKRESSFSSNKETKPKHLGI